MAGRRGYYEGYWPPYVPVAQRRAKAEKAVKKLSKSGMPLAPVCIEGRMIARSFWGKAWCSHLESFSDYGNRLPRGRTYVRNGSVCHLEILPGRISAMVSGTSLYQVDIQIEKLSTGSWSDIRKKCTGHIGSILELLQGKISDQVMTVVTDRRRGLFPLPGEISFRCSCPDWAVMCKHVAAVLYGVGNRLDARPELLFLLRDVDAADLLSAGITLPEGGAVLADSLEDDSLADIFGIDIDTESPAAGLASIHTEKSGPRTPGPSKSGPAPKARKPGRPSGKPPAKPFPVHTAQAMPAVSPRPIAPPASNRTPQKSVTPASHRASPSLPPPPVPAGRLRPSGASVTRLRKKLKLSAAEFARQLGVSEATVHRWEGTPGRLTLQSRSLKALERTNRKIGGKIHPKGSSRKS